MHTEDYISEKTGLLLVDLYNDFLSPTGKFWPRAREVAEEVNLLCARTTWAVSLWLVTGAVAGPGFLP
jgi:hypothetical protein